MQSANITDITVNTKTVNTIRSEANQNGSTVIIKDIGTDATVTITEELIISEELNVTHSITGDVTAGETTIAFDPVTVAVTETEPDSIVDEYDANNDGDISITELGTAGADFLAGDLSITELGRLGQRFLDD